MRILWMSNAPWAATGYGNQTKLFVPRLQEAGHDMAIFAFYGLEGGLLNWNGIQVYPRGFHEWGIDVAGAHAAHWQADVVISLVDAWVMDMDYLRTIGIPYAPWFPVDSEPVPPPVLRKVQKADYRLVFSKFAERMLNRAGLDCIYIPHGVDTGIFKPIKRDAARSRQKFDPDVFLVGMVAANKGLPSRKAYPANIEAFARFHRSHPDSKLYIHTMKNENGETHGVNLPEFCQFLGLVPDRDVIFSDQYGTMMGMPDDYMVDLYNSMDVLLLASMGEGFGIPLLEAQACGTPVITGEWTACEELAFSGWTIPKDESDPWWTPQATYQFMPRVAAIEARLEEAYAHKDDDSFRVAARNGAIKYSADKIVKEYWLPALERIERSNNARADLTPEANRGASIRTGELNPSGGSSQAGNPEAAGAALPEAEHSTGPGR